MTVIAWIVEPVWPACVDAARAHAPADAEIVLLHVTDPAVAGLAHGAYAGLLGRGQPRRDPGIQVDDLAAVTARQLLADAAARLGRPATTVARSGRVQSEVLAAADGAQLLVLARDGDCRHLGPHSLSHASHFIVDHAPCPVLLVGPGSPPPAEGHRPPPPPHQPPPPPPPAR
jgi:nucleotide-binding universal stress UspA family protein